MLFDVVEKKATTVSYNTKSGASLSDFFENLGWNSADAGENLATNVMKTPERKRKIGAKIGSAAVSKKLEQAV